jgi:hypothetical protein
MNLSTQTKTQQTMSSVEIAKLTKKRHGDVMRDIRVIIEQLEDNANLRCGFMLTEYKADNGKNEPCYQLDYEATMIVLTGYDVVARAKVIKRWQELEQQAIKPKFKPTGFLPPIAKEMRGALSIAKMLGLRDNQAILHADEATHKVTGHSPMKLLGIELSSPKQERHFNVTTLAEEMKGFTARSLNKELEAKGFQVKVGKAWSPTEKGQPFAVLLDKNKSHTHGTVQHLEWRESIKHELFKANVGGK